MTDALHDLLATIPSGPVSDAAAFERLLGRAWPGFRGGDEEGMEGYKLIGRTEDLAWYPPFLTFTIERHGGTAQGSTRAELLCWRVDVAKRTAGIVSRSRRQLYRAAPEMDVKALARAVAHDILNGRESPALKRYPDGRVRVLIGAVIPDEGFRRTVSGRRKRFRKVLEELLAEQRWRAVGLNSYSRDE